MTEEGPNSLTSLKLASLTDRYTEAARELKYSQRYCRETRFNKWFAKTSDPVNNPLHDSIADTIKDKYALRYRQKVKWALSRMEELGGRDYEKHQYWEERTYAEEVEEDYDEDDESDFEPVMDFLSPPQ